MGPRDHIVAIDLGGTTTTCCIFDDDGLAAVFSRPTPSDIDGLTTLLMHWIDFGGTVAVAACGPVEGERLIHAPNLHAAPIALERIRRAGGYPAVLLNDADAFTLAEAVIRDADNVVLGVTLGTGVGGGVVWRRTIVGTGMTGEVGHVKVETDGRSCGCGAEGCLEAYAGIAGLVSMAREEGMTETTPESLEVAARRGDMQARRVWRSYGRVLGRGLAPVIEALAPSYVVFGGGLSAALPHFRASFLAEIERRILHPVFNKVSVERSRLGSLAPCYGAIFRAREVERGCR